MDPYFNKFPTISYNGYSAKNIMLRTKIIDRVYDDPKYFYSIEVRNGVRPDTIANEIYDDQYMSWLVYLSNRVVDPYYQWGLSQYDFTKYIEEKYGSVANAQGRIAHWQNNWYTDSDNITISQYNNLQDYSKAYYEPVLFGNKVLEYRRKQVDWTVNTNQIWEYKVSADINLTLDQKVTVYDEYGVAVANGQVLSSNSSVIRIQHVFGQTNTLFSTIGTETSNVAVDAVNLVAINIPDTERVYWSEVTYYDIESQINANNSNVRVLSRDHAARAALELKRLLNP